MERKNQNQPRVEGSFHRASTSLTHLGADSMSCKRYWCAAKLHASAAANAPTRLRALSTALHRMNDEKIEKREGHPLVG